MTGKWRLSSLQNRSLIQVTGEEISNFKIYVDGGICPTRDGTGVFESKWQRKTRCDDGLEEEVRVVKTQNSIYQSISKETIDVL